jgi:hypothetical protein
MMKKLKVHITRKDKTADYVPGMVNMDLVRFIIPSGIDDGIQSLVFDSAQGGQLLVKATMKELEGVKKK